MGKENSSLESNKNETIPVRLFLIIDMKPKFSCYLQAMKMVSKTLCENYESNINGLPLFIELENTSDFHYQSPTFRNSPNKKPKWKLKEREIKKGHEKHQKITRLPEIKYVQA